MFSRKIFVKVVSYLFGSVWVNMRVGFVDRVAFFLCVLVFMTFFSSLLSLRLIGFLTLFNYQLLFVFCLC